MEISHINPFVRYARRHKVFYAYEQYSICYDCRLFYFQNGYGTVEINQKEYNFSKGTILYLPFGTKYRFKPAMPQDKIKVLVFNFDLDHTHSSQTVSLGTANEVNFQPKNLQITEQPDAFKQIIIKIAPQLENILLQCISEFLNEGPLYREVGSACIKQCLSLLLREQQYTANTPLVQQAIAYIEEHFANNTLQNSDIAEHFGYHPYYLSTLLKQSTGYTLHTYLVRHRIQMAKNYLLTTNLDISTVSWRCGFSSVPFFIKTFKEHTGSTPKKYRSDFCSSNL